MNVQQQTVKTNPAKTISHTVDKAIVPHAVVDAVMIIAQSAIAVRNGVLRKHPLTERPATAGGSLSGLRKTK
tara:strand:- start:452 stop:667 length:216 start_codon:yes stop_codon:yes gene_type:complete